MSNCALIGLPNTGKTSFFNVITNSHYKTGNWSGVTVTEHRAAVSNTNHILIDLPGIMGLFDSDVLDAQVSLQALEQADVLIQVLDARHLHRDLILTIQLLAYEKPLIAVLTHLSGPIEKIQKVLPVEYVFDAKKVSASLLADAITNSGIVDIRVLLEWPIGYDDALLNAPQYLSVEKQLFHLVKNTTMDVIVHEAFFNTARTLLNRHGFLQKQVVKTMWLDRWVLSPLTGMGLFFTLMYTMFFVTIGIGGAVGELFSDIIEAVISLLPLTLYGVMLQSVLAGMAMCFAFVPILWIMYLFIGYMEHSGYLARVAVLADILMRPIGLSGHSFIPLLLGFGCNVPAVMSIRVVEGRTQRLLTALMVPFISCSARLSILVLFAATFFSHIATALVMGLYLAGLILAFGVLYWLKKLLNVEHSASMSLSLPQYQWPQWSQINQEVAVRVKAFIRRSARLIILFSGLVGFLANINYYGVVCLPQFSILADMGRLIAPYFGFMGLDEQVWQPVVALIAGVVAKEVILTTLNSLYHVSDLAHVSVFEQIYDAVVNFSYKILGLVGLVEMPAVELVNQTAFSKQTALAYMVFVLLYFPCVSTLVVLYKECGIRWAAASFVITSVLSAWAAKVVYKGFGVETLCLLGMMILTIVIRRGYDTFRNQNIIYKEAISDINSNY